MILMIQNILLTCNCELTPTQALLVMVGIFEVAYIAIVFMHLMHSGYQTKWKFIFDLFFPFGALVRKMCMSIARMVKQIKRLK